MTAFEGWANFYVIVGSSAGALIGLQFVVMALIADLPMVEGDMQAGRAFSTPSVVHFGAVLFLSAILCAPWTQLVPVVVVLALAGFGGVAYSLVVARRMRAQTAYQPVFEDWLFHALLPFAAYALLARSAYFAEADAPRMMFFVGGAALLLLFVGIHNAWDTVTHLVFIQKKREKGAKRIPSSAQSPTPDPLQKKKRNTESTKRR